MTKEQFRAALPYALQSNIDTFYQPIVQTFARFGINTPLRQAAFIGQIAHESGSLKYVREIASGAAYEGRKDLGNVNPGDGIKFKGRGLIQCTGRANYKKASEYFGVDFIADPELLEKIPFNVAIAGWYWHRHQLNQLADIKDYRKITKIINGGYNGYDDRVKHYNRALKALNVL